MVSNFIVQALRAEPITLYGDGSQSRSFCYVDDLIDGLIRLMESDASITGPINLGNPDEFTMRELAEKVLAQTGSVSTITTNPLPQDDPETASARHLAGEGLPWLGAQSKSGGRPQTYCGVFQVNIIAAFGECR